MRFRFASYDEEMQYLIYNYSPVYTGRLIDVDEQLYFWP